MFYIAIMDYFWGNIRNILLIIIRKYFCPSTTICIVVTLYCAIVGFVGSIGFISTKTSVEGNIIYMSTVDFEAIEEGVVTSPLVSC